MLVSAISQNYNLGNKLNSNAYFNNRANNENTGDTAFNSLTPFISRRNSQYEKSSSMLYKNICEWQNFCHDQAVGENLDTTV